MESFFNMVKELVWGLGLSLFLLPWVLGHGSFVKNFLAAPLWTPFARLTYGAYLLHPIVQMVWFNDLSQLIEFTLMNFVSLAVASTVVTFGVSLVTFLLVEKPLANLEYALRHR
eukprot:TRINITY_DN22881_c0_g1_i1.p1 TRINITY_DN22881_c0_g1~~TRINITY_DN22881_c0_g1_i1.p1  ORF type:complete len:134 (-),score=29.14 TRINITY_DN22881_c0_g1_i1:91-432(-)